MRCEDQLSHYPAVKFRVAFTISIFFRSQLRKEKVPQIFLRPTRIIAYICDESNMLIHLGREGVKACQSSLYQSVHLSKAYQTKMFSVELMKDKQTCSKCKRTVNGRQSLLTCIRCHAITYKRGK